MKMTLEYLSNENSLADNSLSAGIWKKFKTIDFTSENANFMILDL